MIRIFLLADFSFSIENVQHLSKILQTLHQNPNRLLENRDHDLFFVWTYFPDSALLDIKTGKDFLTKKCWYFGVFGQCALETSTEPDYFMIIVLR